MKLVLVFILGFVALSSSKVYFKDDFSNPDWESRWVASDWKKASSEAGKWELSAGNNFGLRTTEDYRFYAISSKLDKFSNKDKPLVIQYSLEFETRIECGGGYIKILPEPLNQKEFGEANQYNIMFGPDLCGGNKKIHAILHKNGKNHLIKRQIQPEEDAYTHTYTLIIQPDNTYKVLVDGAEKASGTIEEDWDILPAKKINDPAQSKPADWVDEKMIDDPEDHKPADWDSIPAEISDPSAKKPDDWDNELDGEWEAPKIPNPDYKGPWRARRISNPAYKGEWVHPQIDNPDYKPDPHLYLFENNGFLGVEVWQVKSGSVFSNFLITDDPKEAEDLQHRVNAQRDGEKAAEKVRNDAKAAEEAAKAKDDHDHDDHDHDHDHDDDEKTDL